METETKTPTAARSHTMKKLELDLEKEKYNDSYSTCCSRTGTTDARLIRYVSRFSLSSIVLIFACYQLITARDCDSLVPFYTSLITLLVGTWVKLDGNTNVTRAG